MINKSNFVINGRTDGIDSLADGINSIPTICSEPTALADIAIP